MTVKTAETAVDRTREAALRLLTHRPRSVRELADRLAERFPADAVDAVVGALAGGSLLDDDAFARWWTESRTGSRPMAAAKIAAELAQKGVSPEITARAVAEVDDAGNARTLAARFARTLPTQDYDRFARRLAGRLARRGYGHSLVRSVVRETWSEVSRGAPAAGEDAPNL